MKLFLIVMFGYFWVTHVSSCQTQNQVCKLCPKAQHDLKKESPVVKTDWTPGDEDDLKFHVVTGGNNEIPPTIQARFSNGEQDDLVLKHYRINEHAEVGCNYLGHLQNDPYSSVAVTGCLNSPEDKLEITMVSDNYLKTVSVDFRGNTQKIKSPYEEKGLHTTLRNDKEWNQSDDEIINDNLEKQAQNAKISSIPSKLRATIKFGYEDTMKEWLGSQDFDSWIQAPLAHAQAIYKHKSLGTEIEFEVVGKAIYQKGARWVTFGDDGIDHSSWNAAIAATQASMLNEPAVVYSWWCSADNWAGAWGAMGTLCTDNSINLNMRIDGALKNGMILAHELGHNFGMMHDWDDILGGVGGPCDGDGIMSLGGGRGIDQPLRWSSCSRTSFEQYYFGLNWGCNCLLDISEDDEGQNHCEETCNPYFVDIYGDNCEEYRVNEWCSSSGGYGTGWDESYGTFEDYAVNGQTATVCPQCGCAPECRNDQDCPSIAPQCISGICRDCDMKDKYLPRYADDARMPFSSDSEAIYHCNRVRDCKGITLETDSNEWTLRASEEPKNSTSKEISRLKKCFAGRCDSECSYSNCKGGNLNVGGVQLGINQYCEHYCVSTTQMLGESKKKHVPAQCVSLWKVPANLTKIISCHSCKENRIRKLKKGVLDKKFTGYEKEHDCDSRIDSREFTCYGKTLISDDAGYNGYADGCTGPHEHEYDYTIRNNTSARITINFNEPHYVSKIRFDPPFRPSRQETRQLVIKFSDGDTRKFEVGKNFGEVGSASIDIRKPLQWTKSIEILGITSKTFVDNKSRFGYNKIDIFECVGKCCDYLKINAQKAVNTTDETAGIYMYDQDYQGYPVYKKLYYIVWKNRQDSPTDAMNSNSTSTTEQIIDIDSSNNDHPTLSSLESNGISNSSTTESSEIEFNYFLSWNKTNLHWILHRIRSDGQFINFIETKDHEYKKSLMVSRMMDSYKCPSSIGTFDSSFWSFTSKPKQPKQDDSEMDGSGSEEANSGQDEPIINVSCI